MHASKHLKIKDWSREGNLLRWQEAEQSLLLLTPPPLHTLPPPTPQAKDRGKRCEMGAAPVSPALMGLFKGSGEIT